MAFSRPVRQGSPRAEPQAELGWHHKFAFSPIHLLLGSGGHHTWRFANSKGGEFMISQLTPPIGCRAVAQPKSYSSSALLLSRGLAPLSTFPALKSTSEPLQLRVPQFCWLRPKGVAYARTPGRSMASARKEQASGKGLRKIGLRDPWLGLTSGTCPLAEEITSPQNAALLELSTELYPGKRTAVVQQPVASSRLLRSSRVWRPLIHTLKALYSATHVAHHGFHHFNPLQ
jgi:hypothetical protein